MVEVFEVKVETKAPLRPDAQNNYLDVSKSLFILKAYIF